MYFCTVNAKEVIIGTKFRANNDFHYAQELCPIYGISVCLSDLRHFGLLCDLFIAPNKNKPNGNNNVHIYDARFLRTPFLEMTLQP